jgi:hypothetical protein
MLYYDVARADDQRQRFRSHTRFLVDALIPSGGARSGGLGLGLDGSVDAYLGQVESRLCELDTLIEMVGAMMDGVHATIVAVDGVH